MDKYHEYLENFDFSRKDTFVSRRLAYKPLYEFFKRIVFYVGVNLCYLHERTFKNLHLKPIWVDLKPRLFQIDNQLDEWDILIKQIDNIRQDVEHNQDYDVNQNILQNIRDKAPEFRTWILNTGRKYYKKSKNFTFKETLYNQLNYFLHEAEILIREYGEKPPFLSNLNEEDYTKIPQLLIGIKSIEKEVSKLKEISSSDLLDFIKLIRVVTKFRCIEEGLLSKSICPKCGKKIIETQKNVGGEYDGPPDMIHYRIGCEKCDYIVNEETIDL